ncbi:MAG: hypothetical protein M1827_006406 [Pycnora praestabilis]|nr:MAG: hypothetical protein M1827_006406 [Pycnora praestabilis]
MDTDIVSDASSPLSSARSLSPPLSDAYPSPSSSQELCGTSPPADGFCALPATIDSDGPPPAKKRRIAEPKPRTTEYLNLAAPTEDESSSHKTQLDLLLKVLRKKRKIVVIAGAGISVSAGIPDFRSSTGLFSSLRSQHSLKASGKHLFDASVYKTDSSTSSFHDMVRSLSHMISSTQPTAFHHLLATLAHEGRLMRLYSQNVDGIDTSLPPLATSVPLSTKGPWPRTVQLHGGLSKMVCQKCHHLSDFQPALFDGPEPPSCKECETMDAIRTNIAGKRSHGIGKLRPRMVLYNEHNPDDEAIGAVTRADLRSRPDAVIVVGTSLKVPGVRRIVREMCGVARGRRDGITVWINNGPEPLGKEFEKCWDLVVRGNSDEVAQLAQMRKWDDNEIGEFNEYTQEELERVKREGGQVEVVVQTAKIKSLEKIQGVLTPMGSPPHKPSTIDKIFVKQEAPESAVHFKVNGNSASKSTSIVNMSKKMVKASTESKMKKAVKKKGSLPTNTPKINKAFKITKSAASTASYKTKVDLSKPKSKPKRDEISSAVSTALAMRPLSPQEIRNNHHIPNSANDSPLLQLPKLMFPNLTLPKLKSSEPYPQPELTSSRRTSETVSPTGPLPADLAHILN